MTMVRTNTQTNKKQGNKRNRTNEASRYLGLHLTQLSLTHSLTLFLTLYHYLLDADAEKFVTCGSVVKLTHSESGHLLNSEAKNLGGGSGQQVVTWIEDKSETSSLWWIREAHDDDYCTPGHPMKCNSKIRLTHLDTMRNLHTHHHLSPLSRQQEISCFGNDGDGDSSDDWIVECSSQYWKRHEKVRLKHVATDKYLGGSSTVKFNAQNCGGACPIMNHLEAFGRQRADPYSEVQVQYGIHISK